MPAWKPLILAVTLLLVAAAGVVLLRSYDPQLSAGEIEDCRQEALDRMMAGLDEPRIMPDEWDSFVAELGDCFR